jgi:hypothetical protein
LDLNINNTALFAGTILLANLELCIFYIFSQQGDFIKPLLGKAMYLRALKRALSGH